MLFCAKPVPAQNSEETDSRMIGRCIKSPHRPSISTTDCLVRHATVLLVRPACNARPISRAARSTRLVRAVEGVSNSERGCQRVTAGPKRSFPAYQPLPPIRRNCYIHPRVPDCGHGPARSRLKVANKQAHVQTNSDRQSRRDRLPDHQDGPPDGDRDRRGLFRGRPRRAPRRDGRRGGPDRAAGGGRKLSRDRQDRRGLPARPAPRRCIPATASCPSARPFRARSARPASSSSAPTPTPSPPWATRSNPRRPPRRPRSRPCRAISASSTTRSTR